MDVPGEIETVDLVVEASAPARLGAHAGAETPDTPARTGVPGASGAHGAVPLAALGKVPVPQGLPRDRGRRETVPVTLYAGRGAAPVEGEGPDTDVAPAQGRVLHGLGAGVGPARVAADRP